MRYLIIFLISSVFYFKSDAQTMAARAQKSENKIIIRLIPLNEKTWLESLKGYYKIEKFNWQSTVLPDTTQLNLLHANSVFILKPASDDVWKNAILKNKKAAMLLSSLKYKPSVKSEQNKMLMGLCLMLCDADSALAHIYGLLLNDAFDINTVYKIQLYNQKEKKTGKPIILSARHNVEELKKEIFGFKINANKNVVDVEWNHDKTKVDFSTYYIERSIDEIHYDPINKDPIVPMYTQYEKNKIISHYSDTIKNYSGAVFYRMYGVSAFGVKGNYSSVLSANIIPPMQCVAWYDSTSILENKKIKLFFHWPLSCQSDSIKSFAIYRSDKENGIYHTICNMLNPAVVSYTDSFPLKTNYYKIMARSKSGDSTFTFSIMALLPDVEAPLAPSFIDARVDTSGKIQLTWRPNKEKDLLGYRVFRCNAQYEDVSEVTKVIVKDTCFTDSIQLKTTTKWVFYRLTAVDKVYNNSPYSEWVRIRRPDIIAPVAPVFSELKQVDTAINVRWTLSPSDDVWRYSLYRVEENIHINLIGSWDSNDSIFEYRDCFANQNKNIRYKIAVCDSALNISHNVSPNIYFQAPKILKAIRFNATANREAKYIQLKWEAPAITVYRYTIYRKKENESWRIHKTLNGKILEYTDKELNISNIYEYQIKAETIDGRESLLNNAIKVTY